ncbi:MAG: hypothetical protein MJ197_06555 [Bacteroidales bacterium]|nr:hypothetical protein [Bacteroidales bacterium]
MKIEQENEIIILLVNEQSSEYGIPKYKGTSINVAIKDYYSFTTNREKVAVLKWITAQPQFTEMKRFTEGENTIFTLNESEYDDILKTGETPKNLQIALKFVKNKFDVFLLSNPSNTKSADFIIRKKGKLFYVEGKTSSGGSALTTRLFDGAKQSDRIALNLMKTSSIKSIAASLKKAFEKNPYPKTIYLFKNSDMIVVDSYLARSRNFNNKLYKLLSKRK